MAIGNHWHTILAVGAGAVVAYVISQHAKSGRACPNCGGKCSPNNKLCPHCATPCERCPRCSGICNPHHDRCPHCRTGLTSCNNCGGLCCHGDNVCRRCGNPLFGIGGHLDVGAGLRLG